MSFILDPPALFLCGIVLAFLNKKFISSQFTRIIGFFILLIFWIVSGALFLDLMEWPINLFDLTPPYFESIPGKEWMLHTDVTGIQDIPLVLAVGIFLLYPLFLWVGYEFTRALIDPHAIKVLRGKPLTVNDVKSRSRARQKDDPVLLSAVRDPHSKNALNKALELVGGLENFVKPGDKVVVKPNICGGNPDVPGSFTSKSLIEELARLIHEIGATCLIVDSDMVWTDFEDVAKAQGWIDWAKDNNFPLINLRKANCVKFDFGSSSKVGISIASKIMIDADVIISVPAMKTHLLTNVTLGMKNMYGTFPEGDKAKYHKIGIEDVIVDMNSAFTPTLTIIDGTIGGESIGPLTCKPLNYETIIISNDVVAADSLAAFMMGFDPINDIEHIQKAHQKELGRGDVTFDWNSFPYAHPKDGKWIKPDPTVTRFYNDAIELTLKIPTMKKFMNAASDFLLYDTATLPIFENITPAFLGVLSDIFSGIFNIWGRLRGGRKKFRISSKIEEIKKRINFEKWPSEELKEHLLTIGTTPELLVNPQLEAIDITRSQPEKSSQLASEFTPEVLLQGLELRSEKKTKSFGGMMYRVLENQNNPSERCIQYLYTWMHQKWFWSGWYNIIVPLFLSGLGVIIFTQTDETSWFWTYIAIGITMGFLLIAGGLTVIRTIRGWRRTGKISYIYRHQFSLIVYAVIFSGILYELPPRWNGSTIIPPIEVLKDYIDIVYVPITSIIFLVIPIIVFIIMIQPFISLFTHKIDFAPVFVYLKQKGSDWKVTKVRYDKFHHDVATCEKKELKRFLIKDKRIKLAVPNTWHSMTTTRGLGKIISFFGLLGFILSYIVLAGLLYYYPEAVKGMDLIAIAVALSLLCAYAFFALNQTKLQKQFSSHDLREQGLILNPEKLAILWNLVGEAPSLKVRQKLQDPFNPDPMFWNSFFDLKSEKTIFVELKAIRERTGKIISFLLGIMAVILAFIGFYIGGFWEHSLGQLQTPNYGWIVAFLLSFGIAILAFLIYTTRLSPKLLLFMLIVTALFALIDETIFTYGNLWNYLDGEPVRLAFAVFGWPVFVILIIGLSNWILKYINLPEYRGGFVAKIMNFLPVLALLGIFIVVFVAEGGSDEVLNRDPTTQVLIIALIAVILIFSILFGLTHTFKQNLVVMIVAMMVGGMMESLGNLCGYWTHFSFTPILPEIAPSLTPIFLVILWAFRVLTLLFIARTLRHNILRSD
ncbi:MAG: DUF362 domain-containing protein [Candidatus Hodarchaeota archaeon]